MAHVTDIRVAGSSFFHRAAALRDTLKTRYAQYRVYRTTMDELQNLTQRDLYDLGISRSSIKSIALEAAYK